MTISECKNCHIDSPFFLGAVRALIKAMDITLNQLSSVSWVTLHRCLLITVLAFSIFFEDQGLQEQCKCYSILRAFDTPWVIAALKAKPLSLWTSAFKIPLTPWEVSTRRFCPLVNLGTFSSVQFSRSVVSDSLQLHELQHARPPCPSQTPGAYSNSCPLSQWCHPAISSSVVPVFSCPQSLPASGSFPVSQLFTWGGQSIGISASASVLPMNSQDWSPLGWTDWISLQ